MVLRAGGGGALEKSPEAHRLSRRHYKAPRKSLQMRAKQVDRALRRCSGSLVLKGYVSGLWLKTASPVVFRPFHPISGSQNQFSGV